jgi:hypothetical protein
MLVNEICNVDDIGIGLVIGTWVIIGIGSGRCERLVDDICGVGEGYE